MFLPIIMAGGSGTRLWPLSRSGYPKQFLPLTDKNTMFQNTVTRLEGLKHQPCMFICSEQHRFIAAEQIRQLGIEHNGILLEPEGRNTAPAIALAAFQHPNATLLILAADHVIDDKKAFHEAVLSAEKHAEKGKLVTFGIVPNHAETGYGYIKRGNSITDEKTLTGENIRADTNINAFNVEAFIEKPNFLTAKEYFASGDYYWNSGIFMFKASAYLQALKTFRSDIYEICQKASHIKNQDMNFIRIDESAFLHCPKQSVDYAVMEPVCAQDNDQVVVVPLAANWNDIGSFSALMDISNQDENGNSFKGDVKAINTQNSLVHSDHRLIATVGIEDLIVIDTKDSLLVAKKSRAQDVQLIVNALKQENRPELALNREVYRPWGKYDSIDNGARFQAKRITVNPGAKLSIQMHHHRSEHWIIVTGTAKVTNGDDTILLTENQSTYIPLGTIHALENPGKVPLELIEVQTGSYFGEDDIIRFEDIYGRH